MVTRNIKVPQVIVKPPKDIMSLSVDQFASMFHIGALGVACDAELVRFKAYGAMKTGYKFKAFNVEMPYLKLAHEIVGDYMRLLVPISYSIGGQTLTKKLFDLEYIVDFGAEECCINLDYTNILSKNYMEIEEEVKVIQEKYSKVIDIAYIIPTTLIPCKEIISICKAIKAGGGKTLKVNPGYGLGVTFEEVMLIKRVFNDYFEVLPSGGIRTFKDVCAYVENGFTNIHSQKTMEFIDHFKKLKEKEQR